MHIKFQNFESLDVEVKNRVFNTNMCETLSIWPSPSPSTWTIGYDILQIQRRPICLFVPPCFGQDGIDQLFKIMEVHRSEN